VTVEHVTVEQDDVVSEPLLETVGNSS